MTQICVQLCLFWLLSRPSWPLSWQEVKHWILGKAANVLHDKQRIAEEMVSWLEASHRAVRSPVLLCFLIVSHHYRLVSNCILWCIPARCRRLRTYQSFRLLWPKTNLKRLIHLQTSKPTPEYSVNHFDAHHLYSDLTKVYSEVCCLVWQFVYAAILNYFRNRMVPHKN